MDTIEPILYPIMRRELQSQGPRYVVQIGDKVVDYNNEFRLYITTRNTNPYLTPDSVAITTIVNFTTTRAGLTGQLLAATIQHEKPELESKKTELLRTEEDFKIQLSKLEDTLLQELANAKGNILENKELLESLNKTKESSATIEKSLEESIKLTESLDKEREAFLPLAETGSKLYFVISCLDSINNMYKFSLNSYLNIFQKSLKKADKSLKSEKYERPEDKIIGLKQILIAMVYNYVSRSLFKADRMMFAMHVVHSMFSKQFKENEWEHFTRTLLNDIKADKKSHIPKWVDDERAGDFQLFKNNLSEVYQKAGLDDESVWRQWIGINDCEKNFPSDRRLTLFQQLIVLQALRPDRLPIAMKEFACKILNLKDISPSTTSIKYIYETETNASEPILIIISPGSDPSEELRELGELVVGKQNYHEIAMGQGQMEIALELLKKCSINGGWLCLKNLHLVVSWLPVLEKELNLLKPNENFRLWMTTEMHPNFPTILLQCSLKITYESPPGIKKNIQRAYENWTPDFISKGGLVYRSQALFVLAWFHAIIQERRNYIPQGWTKFYEFSNADLRVAADIIDRLCDSSVKNRNDIQWEFIHGLFNQAVYGGRIDNPIDSDVLISYLVQYFNESFFSGSGKGPKIKFGPGLSLPSSCELRDYKDVIDSLPDTDSPKFFGLPLNIDRSCQIVVSNQVISQLKILKRSDIKIGSKFDKETVKPQFKPIWKLWEALKKNINPNELKKKYSDDDKSPVKSFIFLEKLSSIRLVHTIDENLKAIHGFINGTMLLSEEIQKIASQLIIQQTPGSWQDQWDGPEDPSFYMTTVVERFKALDKWISSIESPARFFEQELDLSELFRPDVFLNSLRQHAAREARVSMDGLKLVCSFTGPMRGVSLNVKVTGLQLEGCGFDGNKISECQEDSPTVVSLPPCFIAWIQKEASMPYDERKVISLPVYFNNSREKIINRLDVPCDSDHSKWLQMGAAIIMRQT